MTILQMALILFILCRALRVPAEPVGDRLSTWQLLQ
jgi:hypothetical protein